MRIRKYRAWYKHDNPPLKFEQEMKEGEYCRLVHRDKDGFEYSYSIEIVMCDDDWIVEDWIGKTDKNGKEIYEGDICVDEYVDFDGAEDGRKYLKFVVDHEKYNFYGKSLIVRDTNNIEIIGNIHDNPELLSLKG